MTRTLCVSYTILMILSSCGRSSDDRVGTIAPLHIGAQKQSESQTSYCNVEKYGAIREVHLAQKNMILKALPIYPAEALQLGIDGSVNVEVVIDRSGVVLEACPVNGPSELRSAARSAALQCRFRKNFGLDKPARNLYRRDIVTYRFVRSTTEQLDTEHYLVVRP